MVAPDERTVLKFCKNRVMSSLIEKTEEKERERDHYVCIIMINSWLNDSELF